MAKKDFLEEQMNIMKKQGIIFDILKQHTDNGGVIFACGVLDLDGLRERILGWREAQAVDGSVSVLRPGL